MTITFKKTYEDESESYKKKIQKKYEDYFGDHIIPFTKDGEMLVNIIERANQKKPPFSDATNASDKGFKDCLLWFSMLDYFKDNGENEVVFITGDKAGFGNHSDLLQKEFNKVTGKTIEIHPNTYCKELLEQSKEVESISKREIKEIPNLVFFRDEVEEAVSALLEEDWDDYSYYSQRESTFTTFVPFDKEYVKKIFERMYEVIVEHLFEKSISASMIFDFDGRISDCGIEISMQKIEKVFKLYQEVQKNYPQYSDQFFEVVAKILNRNYRDPSSLSLDLENDGEEIPF